MSSSVRSCGGLILPTSILMSNSEILERSTVKAARMHRCSQDDHATLGIDIDRHAVCVQESGSQAGQLCNCNLLQDPKLECMQQL